MTTAVRADCALDRASLPMRLWEKAKVHGVWNPADIDFAGDRARWLTLSEDTRHDLVQLCALFHAGERAVVLRLPPLLHTAASEGRVEEVVYLSSFLWEEAKHLDLFTRFFTEICGRPWHDDGDFPYRTILDDELRGAMDALITDRTPATQVRAAVTYHLVVEGILAESGYRVFQMMTNASGGLPGMQQALTLLHRDESRHIAFGLYLLSRLIVEHGRDAYGALLHRLSELKPLTEAATRRFVRALHDRAGVIREDELIQWSQRQFELRMRRLIDARSRSVPDLDLIQAVMTEDDAVLIS